jgi:4-oxalomesaconate tautomerase
VVPGSVAAEVAGLPETSGERNLEVEHPTGFFTVNMDVSLDSGKVQVRRAALLRTARKLMSGEVFIPGDVWSGP